MVEVELEEFEEFYKKRLNDKFYKEKKVGRKLIDEIRDNLISIKVCMDHFMEAEDKLDKKSVRSLNFFSDRIRKEIDDIDIPDEEISYNNLISLLTAIKKLFNNINDIARKSIPKFQKEAQNEIKELNYITRKLTKNHANLEKFVRKKYDNVKDAEDVLEKLSKFYNLRDNIENAKSDLEQFEDDHEDVKNTLEDLNNKLLELEKDKLFRKVKKLREEIFQLKLKINNQLGFKKALKKLRVEVERGNLHVSNLDENYIREFIKSPIRVLTSDSKDFTKFRGLLVQLRHVLEENKLNLKADKKEKTIEQINEIFDERGVYNNIETLNELKEKLDKAKKTIQKKGLGDELEDVKNEISIYTQKLEHIENDLGRKNKDYLKYLATLKRDRAEFQKSVEKVIDEEFKLTITFTF
ncbi:MAG: hypothetical protein GF317_00910 [Candidatus Lokiarchaeota archaeon]|nr:hypothetical protein [Candidatus Lokiarchaeota archaeon]MBD3198521.1 hypothetical protein [Candidatus Lokiarchaeota archaeon]